jgi:hypothetical protein
MSNLAVYALSIAATALLAGCGGSQHAARSLHSPRSFT